MMMKKKTKQFPTFAYASVLFVLLAGAGMSDGISQAKPLFGEPRVAKQTVASETETPNFVELSKETVEDPTPTLIKNEEEGSAVSSVWANYSNVCETFNVIQSPERVKDKEGQWHYPTHYKRNRIARWPKDRARTRKLIEMVATEMGVAHPEFFVAFAEHESTWNPEAIHILNPDLKSNQRAWKRHSYNAEREAEILGALKEGNAKTSEFWDLKGELYDIQMYKGNPHWDDKVTYNYIIPEHALPDGTLTPEQVLHQSQGVWSFGYGLYGHYAVGYVKMWDQGAPPWVLCGDEGIIATIIQVWAARNDAIECASLTAKDPDKWGTDGDNYVGVLRRLARGKCSDDTLGKKWTQVVMPKYGVPWEEDSDFGDKWPQYEMVKKRGKWVYKKGPGGKKIRADRQAVLEHMLKKAEAKGLLRPTLEDSPMEVASVKTGSPSAVVP